MIAAEFLLKRTRISPGTNRAVFFCATLCESLDDWKVAREIRRLLVRQVLQPVLWERSMRNLLEAGFDKFYEIGPGRVLVGLLKRVQRKVDCQNVAA